MKTTGTAHATAPSKMILLDPDMDPDPAPKATSVKRAAASSAPKKSADFRLPSARTLARFLSAAQTAVRLKGQVTVLLTTDAAIRRLNRQFRGKNKATDVLSFPSEGPFPGSPAEEIAGDIAISVTTALGQAADHGHSLSTEIKVLILHGLLHLAGYDHEADSGQMARRERLLRARLGLPKGLIERAEQPKQVTRKSPDKSSSGAKARIDSGRVMRGLKPPPPSGSNVPAGAKARAVLAASTARLKSCPDTKLGFPAAFEADAISDSPRSGLKPKIPVTARATRLTPRPFKATKSAVPTSSSADFAGPKRAAKAKRP